MQSNCYIPSLRGTKQSRKKVNNMLDCFVPRNDERGLDCFVPRNDGRGVCDEKCR